MIDFKTHHAIDEYGWSEWVSPDHESYLMKCCDCGLIHEMQFAVVKFTGEQDGELEHCDFVKDPDVQSVFRARRKEEDLHYLVTMGSIDFSAGSEARHILERVENEEISASKACELICLLSRQGKGA